MLKRKQLWREDTKNHAWKQILFQKPDAQVDEKPLLLKKVSPPKWIQHLPAYSAEGWKSFWKTCADSQSTARIWLHDPLSYVLM